MFSSSAENSVFLNSFSRPHARLEFIFHYPRLHCPLHFWSMLDVPRERPNCVKNSSFPSFPPFHTVYNVKIIVLCKGVFLGKRQHNHPDSRLADLFLVLHYARFFCFAIDFIQRHNFYCSVTFTKESIIACKKIGKKGCLPFTWAYWLINSLCKWDMKAPSGNFFWRSVVFHLPEFAR